MRPWQCRQSPYSPMRTDSSTGILCNSLRTHDLTERLQAASSEELPVLQAEIEQVGGRSRELFAINEIVLERQVFQQAKLSVAVRGNGDAMNINGDGLVLTTPIGSTGYNRTIGGRCYCSDLRSWPSQARPSGALSPGLPLS